VAAAFSMHTQGERSSMDNQEMTLKQFWQAGGFGMYMVTAFGLTLLLGAVRFALRPDERDVPFTRAMTGATLAAIAMSVASDFGTVCWSVPRLAPKEEWQRWLLLGSFESLTPAMLGFGFVSLAWLAHAIGIRRLARALP
jgi:hypothetical protein